MRRFTASCGECTTTCKCRDEIFVIRYIYYIEFLKGIGSFE